MDRSLDPFDAAVLVYIAASAAFGLLVAGLVYFEAFHLIASVWPVLAAAATIAWLTIESWSPPSAPLPQQARRLAIFVGLEALATTPLVALGWELAGPATVVGAALAAASICAGLIVVALIKPTTYLQPIDPLIVLIIMGLVVISVGLGLGLPLRLAWAVPLLALTGTFVLREIANVAGFGADQHISGGTRLFACAVVLFAELLQYFVGMARGDDLLWTLLVRALGGADAPA